MRALVRASAVALGVVACATYENAPTPLGLGGDSGAPGTGGSHSASGAGAGGMPSAGTAAGIGGQAGNAGSSGGQTTNAGSAGHAGSAGSAGSAGQGGSAGTAGSGGSSAGSVGAGGGGVPMAGAAGQGGGAGGTDGCPSDAAKTSPGVCGCGIPDVDTGTAASCVGIKSALVHRYDFEGTGTAVIDRVGSADGVVKGGATLSQVGGKGVVVLAGGATGSYVDLPNKLLSALTNATLEAWVTWGGGAAWQRVFDFGDSSSATPEDNPANGKSYLFLTPATDDAGGGAMRAVYSLSGGAAAAETRVDATTALPQTLTHVALVVDTKGGNLLLYVNGAATGTQAFSGALASINDVNVWLGRSQYEADPELTGTFHDFRVYDAALTPLQIATSFAGGPDPAFLSK